MSSWNEYPRPGLKRKNRHIIINDGWTLNGKPIRLPFPPEADLSAYEGKSSVSNEQPSSHIESLTRQLVYSRELIIPEEAIKEIKKDGHFLLHFGAVDQIAQVYVDGELITEHRGGYTPFTADLSDLLRSKCDADGKHDKTEIASNQVILSIEVRVTDELDHSLPYGKQRKDRGGMWYTPISGIWQTVWCEWVPHDYIHSIRFVPDKDGVRIIPNVTNESLLEYASIKIGDTSFSFTAHDYSFSDGANNSFSDGANNSAKGIEISWDKLGDIPCWSPENPVLINVEIRYGEDCVESYFARRTVEIRKVGEQSRICINSEPVFLNGVLDQGYHLKGIFMPETPDEYERDILRMKELGFNMLRKHIKVEPELFYYACDRLGMYVMQDMVNNGEYNFVVDTALATLGLKLNDKGRYKDLKQKADFVECAEETQDFLFNHPSVIGYTVFNEGWGQTDSDLTGDYLKSRDETRFYDYTSGWFEQKHSDLESVHVYFRTKKLCSHGKPLLLSEFGGFTRLIDGHVFNPDKSYGYGKCGSEAELTDRIIATYEEMVISAIDKGLCGCVYTQLSDIEDEINGLYTYDRQICKVDKEKLREFMEKIMYYGGTK